MQPVPYLFEKGAEAGDGGTEVERGEYETDGDQTEHPGGEVAADPEAVCAVRGAGESMAEAVAVAVCGL